MYTCIPINVSCNVPLQVTPQPDPFGSHQQASGIILAGFLTTLHDRIGRVHLDVLISWDRHNFETQSTNFQ